MIGLILAGVFVLVFAAMIVLLWHVDLRDSAAGGVHLGHPCALPPSHRENASHERGLSAREA